MRGPTKTTITGPTAGRIYMLYAQGLEPKELAAEFDTSLATITRIIRGQIHADVTGGRNISRHDAMVAFRKAYIQACWESGMTNQGVIAAHLGISRQTLNQFMIRHKLGHRAPNRKAA